MTAVLRQIVPALPPQREGIGGYAVALARGLRDLGCETEFLCPVSGEVDFQIGPWPPKASTAPTLLHYANYGFHRHGLPRELVGSLVERRASAPDAPLLVFFHELFATAWPWSRTFWTSRLQRSLVQRLARSADRGFTTLPVYETMLRRLAPSLLVQRLAMPSPVGEPASLTQATRRSARLIVFGGSGNRAAAYRMLRHLTEVLHEAQITSVVDVGPDPSCAPSFVGGLRVEVLGSLTDATLSELLLDCRLAILAYPADFLGKSTAFSCFAAHGVPCLVPRRPKFGPVEAPCLRGEKGGWARLDDVGSAVHAWYQDHRLAVHTEAMIRTLGVVA